jgi:uncharacterized RDD family membrane protein YckC
MVYDGVLVVAVWMVATAVLLPFTGGEAVRPGQGWYTAYLMALAFAYFGWFWTRGGQTLGMRSWRLRLVGTDRSRVRWGQALVRFLGACVSWLPLGAGFLWALVDPCRRTWHDRLSGTDIVDGF